MISIHGIATLQKLCLAAVALGEILDEILYLPGIVDHRSTPIASQTRDSMFIVLA